MYMEKYSYFAGVFNLTAFSSTTYRLFTLTNVRYNNSLEGFSVKTKTV